LKIKLKLGLSSKPAPNLLKTWFLREKPVENELQTRFLLDLVKFEKPGFVDKSLPKTCIKSGLHDLSTRELTKLNEARIFGWFMVGLSQVLGLYKPGLQRLSKPLPNYVQQTRFSAHFWQVFLSKTRFRAGSEG
jgi:hypothetical protein